MEFNVHQVLQLQLIQAIKYLVKGDQYVIPILGEGFFDSPNFFLKD
jgi:hypothetical protein